MSLRERILKSKASGIGLQRVLFEQYGVIENPFPSAGQPFGHPHLHTDVDEKIETCIEEFETTHKSQIMTIEGTQGVGKTNLLNYYQNELEVLYEDDKSYYVIRYYPDPEPTFDAIINKILQEMGENHLATIASELSVLPPNARSSVIDIARNHEVRLVLHKLSNYAKNSNSLRDSSCFALEWLLGLRMFKRHKEFLGIRFRLDTVESKTQALRDLVYVSVKLGLLRGIFLMLDELEKQDYSLSKTPVIRYLSAIRAIIDALPTHFCMVMAFTPEARRRYFFMLPAIAGRLQNVYLLTPIKEISESIALYKLYLESARSKAKSEPPGNKWKTQSEDIFKKSELRTIFDSLVEKSTSRGIEGVTHRDFLNDLNLKTQQKFAVLKSEAV